MYEETFLRIQLSYVWFFIFIGIIIGLLIPLRPFMRSRLHFTIRPNNKLNLERDADALSKIIPEQRKETLIGFCNILRKLGLTLYIK